MFVQLGQQLKRACCPPKLPLGVSCHERSPILQGRSDEAHAGQLCGRSVLNRRVFAPPVVDKDRVPGAEAYDDFH